jgi:hypothetical protein
MLFLVSNAYQSNVSLISISPNSELVSHWRRENECAVHRTNMRNTVVPNCFMERKWTAKKNSKAD